jgi:polysaccharide biosynthesis transport protein
VITESPDGFSIRDLVAIFRRRRRIIYGTVLTFLALAVIYSLLATRRYEATGRLQVQKQASDAMGLQNLINPGNSPDDALEGNIEIQTQAEILQSDTLALSAIQVLRLEDTRDFQPRWNPVGWVLGLLAPSSPEDSPGATLEQSPQRLRQVLQIFHAHLKVSPVGGTRLIQIEFFSADPKTAAAVVNFLMKGLVDYTFQTRFAAMSQTSEWLSGQLTELRKRSEAMQSKVVELQRQIGVYNVGTVDSQGHEQAYSNALDQLQQATTALTQAEQNRILKGAIAQAAANGSTEVLSGLAGNSNSPSINNSMSVIEHLREQQASEQVALKEAESKYGSAYPTLIELRENVAALDRAIAQEFTRIKARAASDYDVALRAEANTQNQYQQAKQRAARLNDKATEFTILNQEADQSRQLYEDLLKRVKEAGVLEGVRSSNITVVDPGRVPAKPSSPNIPLALALSVVTGVFAGCFGSVVLDVLDKKIKTVGEAERAVGQVAVGAMPLLSSEEPPLIWLNRDPHLGPVGSDAIFVETVRGIRTALIPPHGQHQNQVILVTSSIAHEGKTLLSGRLASTLAESGYRVLLVDADLRLKGLTNNLHLPDGPGLSDLLAGERPAPDLDLVEGYPLLEVLKAGKVRSNPASLLGRATLDHWISLWREKYDFILLDTPPLLPVTDALVTSRLADVALLVVRLGFTEEAQLRRAFELLASRQSKRSVRLVLNGISPQDHQYSEYFG